nr:IS3 family transposase [Haemophilus parainfluenzae]
MKKAIKRIKANHPDYGYRRVHASLPGVNHKKVQRLMQTLGLQVQSRKSKKLTTYRGTIGGLHRIILNAILVQRPRNKNG